MEAFFSDNTDNAEAYIVRTYKNKEGKIVQKIVESFGTLQKLKKRIGDRDPRQWCIDYAQELTRVAKRENYYKKKGVKPRHFYGRKEPVYLKAGDIFLMPIYLRLHLDQAFDLIRQKTGTEVNIDASMRMLCVERILNLYSKNFFIIPSLWAHDNLIENIVSNVDMIDSIQAVGEFLSGKAEKGDEEEGFLDILQAKMFKSCGTIFSRRREYTYFQVETIVPPGWLDTEDKPEESTSEPQESISDGNPVEDEGNPVESQDKEGEPIEVENNPIKSEDISVESENTPIEFKVSSNDSISETLEANSEVEPMEAVGNAIDSEEEPVSTETSPYESEDDESESEGDTEDDSEGDTEDDSEDNTEDNTEDDSEDDSEDDNEGDSEDDSVENQDSPEEAQDNTDESESDSNGGCKVKVGILVDRNGIPVAYFPIKEGQKRLHILQNIRQVLIDKFGLRRFKIKVYGYAPKGFEKVEKQEWAKVKRHIDVFFKTMPPYLTSLDLNLTPCQILEVHRFISFISLTIISVLYRLVNMQDLKLQKVIEYLNSIKYCYIKVGRYMIDFRRSEFIMRLKEIYPKKNFTKFHLRPVEMDELYQAHNEIMTPF